MTNTNKTFAPDYEEEKEHIEVEEIDSFDLENNVIELTYRNQGEPQTVRSYRAHKIRESHNSVENGDLTEEFHTFFHDGKKYAFNPITTTLVSIGDVVYTLAEAPSDFETCNIIRFQGSAPIAGTIQEDVIATIYYESPRSPNIQSVKIEVNNLSNYNVNEIRGDRVSDGQSIKAHTVEDRKIVKDSIDNEELLGRVKRVEFPFGSELTVRIEGISPEQIESKQDRIEQAIKDKLHGDHRDTETKISTDNVSEAEWN